MADDSLKKVLARHGLGGDAELIASWGRPCVRIATRAGEPAADATRLGGIPYLPRGVSRPVGEKGALRHLASLKLSEIAPHDAERLLPPRGFLRFWYDFEAFLGEGKPEDRRGFAVTFDPAEDAPLESRSAEGEAPPLEKAKWFDRDKKRRAFRPVSATFEAAISLPDVEWIETFRPDGAARIDDESWADRYEEARSDLVVAGFAHQILGCAACIQSPMEPTLLREADGVSENELRAHADDWTLLLELAEDASAGWSFGDAGKLWFWIRRAALARADFDDVRIFQQMH